VKKISKKKPLTWTPPGDKPQGAGNPNHNNNFSSSSSFFLSFFFSLAVAEVQQLWSKLCESFGTWGQKSIVFSTRPPGDFLGMNTVTPTSAIAHSYLHTYLFSLGHFLE